MSIEFSVFTQDAKHIPGEKHLSEIDWQQEICVTAKHYKVWKALDKLEVWNDKRGDFSTGTLCALCTVGDAEFQKFRDEVLKHVKNLSQEIPYMVHEIQYDPDDGVVPAQESKLAMEAMEVGVLLGVVQALNLALIHAGQGRAVLIRWS